MKMKNLLYSGCVCLLIFQTVAQTPTAFKNTKGIDNKGMSAKNPWIGGQIGYRFAKSNAEFADNFSPAARILQDLDLGTKSFQMPIMGNFGQLRDNSSDSVLSDQSKQARYADLVSSTQGINVGLHPYYTLKADTFFSSIIHGSLEYRLNSFKDTVQSVAYLHQAKVRLGVEVHLGKYSTEKGRYPLTFDISPTISFFDSRIYRSIFRDNESTAVALELTGIVPIGKGLGFLIEGIISKQNQLRIGFIFATESN